MKGLNELEKAQFLDQLGMILDGGIAIEDGLDALVSQVSDVEYANALKSAKEELEQGSKLSKALEKTGYYDAYMIHMIEVGEESGYLDKVIHELAHYYYRMNDTKQKIKDALTYPSILVVMMLVVVIILINNILPLFKNVLSNMGIQVASSTLVLLDIGKNLAILSLVVLAVLVVVVFYVLFTMKGKENSYITLLEKFFVTKKIAYELSVTQFAYALSLLLNSGIPQENALDMCKDLCTNPVLKNKIEALIQDLQSGKSMSDCLIDSKIFKEVYNRLLVIGIKSGHFEKTMNEVAQSYEKDIDAGIARILDVVEPTLVILLSVIVGIILVSVMLPLASIMVNL